MDNYVITNKDEIYLENLQEKQIINNELPDIFKIMIDEKKFIEYGSVRSIPWEMIEKYAPRYAMEFINDKIYREQYISNDEIYILHAFEKTPDMLAKFSVYRYDWLIESGYTPHGNVKEINEFLYYTDEAFSINEFIDIMNAFSNRENEEDVGLATYALISDGMDPLMGMFGVNWENINENGHAIFSGMSTGFKTYLIFIESLIETGALNPYLIYASDALVSNIGWWSIDINNHLDNLMIYLNAADSKKYWYLPPMKVLLVPPEIGPYGIQGVGAQITGTINYTDKYMISSNVSDDKLIKILQIFDAISFEPEYYVLTKYGIENENFIWNGEPYNSGIEMLTNDAWEKNE